MSDVLSKCLPFHITELATSLRLVVTMVELERSISSPF